MSVTTRFNLPRQACLRAAAGVALLFLGPAIVAQTARPAPDLRIESAALVVNFNPSSGAFSVADKRTGRQWEQLDAMDPIPVRKAWTDTNRILADLGGPADFP